MKRFFLTRAILFCVLTLTMPFALMGQVNPNAGEKTRVLYNNLRIVQQSEQFLFGQEFFNSFRYSSGGAHGDEEYSDSKAVTGAHPAVLGSDFHYYLEKSETERGYHTDAVKWAYKQGYVITFDWHISGRGTTTYEYRQETKNLVNNIVNDVNGDRAWLYGQFDKVIDIINNDLVIDNERIPIVFRPWHEMNGGWFWWGSKSTTPANYQALYKLTVEYFKERTTSVLFCWSPNTPVTNQNYFPGKEYVDIIGLDAYEVTASSLRSNLGFLTDLAKANDLVAVFAETGNRTDNAQNAATYWNDVVLPAIMGDPTGKSKRIAWVLTWINASWSYPYVPHGASPSSAKQSFTAFKNSINVLFGDEIANMYIPMDPPVAVELNAADANDLELFPVPSSGKVTISLKNFTFPVRIAVYDQRGRELSVMEVSTPETTIDAAQLFVPGVYTLKASDKGRSISKRVVIE